MVSAAAKPPVVVLGGSGFLGSHVVRAFASRGYVVAAGSRRSGQDARQEASLIAWLAKWPGAWVVNCASDAGGIAYNNLHRVAIYENNLLLHTAVVRACFKAGVAKFINIMPNSTYPGALERFAEPQWWDGPLHPSMLASAMPRKLGWVQAWSYYEQHRFPSIHLVLPNMYGPGDHFDPDHSHALGSLIRKVVAARDANLDSIEIWGSGRPVREWLYVEDAAQGIVEAAEKYQSIEILNLGSGEHCTIAELACLIADAVGWRGELRFDASRPDGAPCKIMQVERMRELLHWQPCIALSPGIARTLAWYQDHLLAPESTSHA